MVTYKNYNVNDAVLAFTEDKNNPEFLDILNRQDLNVGDEITITFEFKGKTSSKLQFNRTIKEIKEDSKEVETSDEDVVTLISKDFLLQ